MMANTEGVCTLQTNLQKKGAQNISFSGTKSEKKRLPFFIPNKLTILLPHFGVKPSLELRAFYLGSTGVLCVYRPNRLVRSEQTLFAAASHRVLQP